MRTKDVKMYKEYQYKDGRIVTIGGKIRGRVKSSMYPESFYHPVTHTERSYYVSDGMQGFTVKARELSIIPLMCIN